MNQALLLVTFTLILGCNTPATQTTAIQQADTIQTVATEAPQSNVYIKDISQYDPAFIAGLSEYGEPLRLIHNYILLGQDTAYFPEEIQLNRETVFKGSRGTKTFVLAVTRINLTTLNYDLRVFVNDSVLSFSKSGKAMLHSLFFLGSEVDEDDLTGSAYGSAEYWDNSQACSFAIRIGDKDENGKLRAKVKFNCEENTQDNIELDDCPTLRAD